MAVGEDSLWPAGMVAWGEGGGEGESREAPGGIHPSLNRPGFSHFRGVETPPVPPASASASDVPTSGFFPPCRKAVTISHFILAEHGQPATIPTCMDVSLRACIGAQ